MSTFILKRVLGLFPTMLFIIIASFCVIRFAPGSPFSSDKAVDPEVMAKLEAKYGFDKSIPEQLTMYIGNVVTGDLGLSTKYPDRTVNEILSEGFPATLAIAFVALIWGISLGLLAGIIGAIRQNTWIDYSVMTTAMLGISVPTFVIGPLLALAFALTLYWFPPGGWGSLSHLVLPGVTLGTPYAGYIARLTRGGMLEVVRSDFVRTAMAKGLRERVIVVRHMLKGGLLPVVTYLGPAVASMMVGSVVVEKIFATPGIGPYFVDAAFNRDVFLVMGIVILYSVFLLLMNLLVDVAYGLLDPRIRYE